MAIKLLGQVWKTAASAPTRRRVTEWAVEPLESSPWNPVSPASTDQPPAPSTLGPAEPVWAETQPWCHD